MADGKFLTPDQLADLGLERLRLPVPTVKLQVIHGFARALDDRTTQAETWAAVLRWIATLELESEVLEALSILLVAKETTTLSAGELRRSISRPSILSDYFMAVIFGQPTLVRSWEKCHSGEVPPLYKLDAIERELSESRIVPPVLSTTLRGLEKRTKLPMMRQWAYEFDRLQAIYGERSHGHLTFFNGSLSHEGTGQFISGRSHVARSAYLRVFALAVDRWQMPEEDALHYAMFATPVDFSFLRMPPGPSPAWTPTGLSLASNTHGACLDVVKEMLVQCERVDDRFLVHYSGPLCRRTRLQADLEIITLNRCGNANVSEDVFTMHEWLPGHVFIPRDDEGNFLLPPWPAGQIFPTQPGSGVRPCLVPALLNQVGYMHVDLVSRTLYLPVSHAAACSLVAHPRSGGADITCEDKSIAELHYWNFQWQPMRHKGLGEHCAVAVTVDKDVVLTLFPDADCTTIRCWRAKVLSRADDYGEWSEHVHFGVLE